MNKISPNNHKLLFLSNVINYSRIKVKKTRGRFKRVEAGQAWPQSQCHSSQVTCDSFCVCNFGSKPKYILREYK